MSLARTCCCVTGVTVLKGTSCSTLPACIAGSPPAPIYLRTTVTVIGTGVPIADGDVVFYKGVCWTLTDTFTPPDPMKVEPVTEVEKLGGCGNAKCLGPWYYKARACTGHEPAACVLIEYCDAQDIFGQMVVPGVRLVSCVVFEVDGKCYTFGAGDFIGYFGDTTDCEIVTSIGTWYRSCCDCSASVGRRCASSESPTPLALSSDAPLCWTGDRQGDCCGEKFSFTWEFSARRIGYSNPTATTPATRDRDDTILHSGNIVVGPRAVCPGAPGTYGMQLSGSGTYERTLISGYPGEEITVEIEHDVYANLITPTDLNVAVPIGCAPGGLVAILSSGCTAIGGNVVVGAANPLQWVTELGGIPTLMSLLTVNGKQVATHCRATEREDNVSGGIVIARFDASWSVANSTGSGRFSYEHKTYGYSPGLGLELLEHLVVTASYRRMSILPCQKCEPTATPGVFPGDSAGDGCGSCDDGDEPTEVLP